MDATSALYFAGDRVVNACKCTNCTAVTTSMHASACAGHPPCVAGNACFMTSRTGRRRRESEASSSHCAGSTSGFRLSIPLLRGYQFAFLLRHELWRCVCKLEPRQSSAGLRRARQSAARRTLSATASWITARRTSHTAFSGSEFMSARWYPICGGTPSLCMPVASATHPLHKAKPLVYFVSRLPTSRGTRCACFSGIHPQRRERECTRGMRVRGCTRCAFENTCRWGRAACISRSFEHENTAVRRRLGVGKMQR